MQPNRHVTTSPGNSKFLRQIGLLLVVCFGLLAMRATQVGLDLLYGEEDRLEIAGSRETPNLTDENQPDALPPYEITNTTVEAGIAAGKDSAQSRPIPPSESAASTDGADTGKRHVKAVRPERDRRQPKKYDIANTSAERSLPSVSLPGSLGQVATTSRHWTRQIHRGATGLTAALKSQFERLRALQTAAASSRSVNSTAAQRLLVDENKLDIGSSEVDNKAAVAVVFNSGNGVVRYMLDEQVHSLEPGKTHYLVKGGPWTIRYHRGRDFGDALRQLNPGVHDFAVTEQGWDLRPRETE